MSTPIRKFLANYPYHIYNRGNRKGDIFINVKDYLRFLKRIKEYKERFEIEFLCYCLLPNHFHFLLRAQNEDSISKFMLTLSTSYSKYFNIKHNLVGRLCQERYRAKLVESDEYLLHLSRYIHLNPISDEIAKLNFSSRSTPGVDLSKIIAYPWSSYREYCNEIKGICNTEFILGYFSNKSKINSYRSFVEAGINESETNLVSHFL